MCHPPRKSLVKGERFIRSEERTRVKLQEDLTNLYLLTNNLLVGLR